jgi:sporulation protein YlmC with PRC-barrel domain
LSDLVDIGLHVVDHQLLDSEGRRCGNVDDLALEGNPGGPLEIVEILSGPGVWGQRAGVLGRIAGWLGGGGTVRIPWQDVDHVAAHVKLQKRAEELGLGRGDDRLRPLIDRIPGADR